ncbi:hypothetical protein GYMLUDRAFT_157247 [Collybiopsis luxurians FD-317 M1]|nr:hypothetical protein GYMLUDRAFT_157247 [Collybiopsis luxurians FD-317 M1]
MPAADKIQPIELASRTGRIKLVKAVEENDAAVAALRSHPETRKHLRYFPEHYSIDEARELREKRAADESLQEFHVLRCEKDGSTSFIGGTMMFHMDTTHKSCEVGILMSPDVHRTGFATDVLFTLFSYIFEVLEMHRLYMKTDSGNVGMRGWLENVAGARKEIHEKEAWVDPINGGYNDVVGYSILEWEWRDRVKGALERKLGL